MEIMARTHLIADDNLNWKTECPTLELLLKIAEYFNMTIKATVLTGIVILLNGNHITMMQLL